MRIVRFARNDGSLGWGLQSELGIQDISGSDATLPMSSLEVMSRWEELTPPIARLARRLGASDEIGRLLCPLDLPGKILCVGLNYRDHAAESNMPVPPEPILFCKMSTAMIGGFDDIHLPSVSQKVDYEAELVIVIGKRARNASEEVALQAIFGYAVGNDVSARDWQLEKPGKQWFLGKTFDTFGPIGPGITLAPYVPKISDLKIQLWLNGELMQNSSTRELVFGPATIVSYLSKVMTLLPGDVIFTGTPPGVGMAQKPPRFLAPNDLVEIEIESLGRIANRCIAEQVPSSTSVSS